jgi:ParB family chromosome partitioning protein
MSAAKKRGLGKGLDALLGGSARTADGSAASLKDGEMKYLPVDLIQPGRYQPRTGMDPEKLKELADSIRAQGVVQPIVVRPIGGGKYEIIAGERRWRAAQIAELSEVPSVVRDVPDQATVAMALIENIQRENLNPLEESTALKRLIEEFDLTHGEAAEAVGRSRAAVSNLLRLQDLEQAVKDLLDAGQLEMGHARALLALKGSDQSQAARQVALKGLSVRETETLVRRLQNSGPSPDKPVKKAVDPDILRLEQDLTERLCARVQLKHQASGKGQLVIHYGSLDELDGLLDRIE